MEIIKELLHLLRINIILFVPPIMVLVVWMIVRRLGYFSKRRSIATTALKANRTSRIAESIILFCTTMAIFVFTATNTSTGGRLLILDQFQKDFATTNIIVAAVAAIGVLIAVTIVFFRRTFIGVTIAVVVMSWYGLMLNGPNELLESLAPEESTIPDATLTFVLTSPDIEGGELWVNGVYLGTLPYETTFEEFYAKVPFWPQEPNENSRENRDGWFLEPRWNPYSDRPSGSLHMPWARITIPQEPTHWEYSFSRMMISDPNERLRIREAEKVEMATRTYYARVKLGNEWGYSDGGSGSSGRYDSRRASVSFAFIFPERLKAIEKLLDIARLCDYSPGPEWFRIMETYNSDGWITVRKAIDTEPDMSKVFDAWAKWKYDLDNVTDSKRAWQVFEKICDEAEERQYYMTSDITGRVVELLLPKLEPQRLINKALKTIRSTRFYSWILWEMNDRVQFGICYSPEVLRTGANRHTSFSMGGNGRRSSPSDYVFAHAIWMLDEMFDSQNKKTPNLVEERLVSEFISWNYNSTNLFQIAAHIGGPHIEQYLLRQNWRADPEELPWGQSLRFHGNEVNGWLYMLANLKSPEGQKFRQKNSNRIMKMADILANDMFMSNPEEYDFIFIDKYLGDDSMAMKYWPRFRDLIAMKEHRQALDLQYKYLIRMEPLSTIDMYAQCWKNFNNDYDIFEYAIDGFNRPEIPRIKREQIYSVIFDCIDRDVSNIEYDRSRRRRREILLQELRSELLPLDEDEQAIAI